MESSKIKDDDDDLVTELIKTTVTAQETARALSFLCFFLRLSFLANHFRGRRFAIDQLAIYCLCLLEPIDETHKFHGYMEL